MNAAVSAMNDMIMTNFREDTKDVFGILTPECRDTLFLASWAVRGPRLEIGCFLGASTTCLAMGMKPEYGDRICSVDTFDAADIPRLCRDKYKAFYGEDFPETGSFRHLWQNTIDFFRPSIYEAITPVESKSANAVPAVCEWLGNDLLVLLFIDADHSYESVRDEMVLYLPLVRQGGLVLFHDYGKKQNLFPGVVQAVDEAVADGQLEMVAEEYLCVTRKR